MQAFCNASLRYLDASNCAAVQCAQESGCGGNWAAGTAAAHSPVLGSMTGLNSDAGTVLEAVLDRALPALLLRCKTLRFESAMPQTAPPVPAIPARSPY
jgi:hypothetical protein